MVPGRILIRCFHFQHTVLNNGNLTIEHDESVEKNGIRIRMNRIEINPSFVNAFMCFGYENYKGWYPELTLRFKNKKINAEPFLRFRTDDVDWTNRSDIFTSLRCYRIGFPTGKI